MMYYVSFDDGVVSDSNLDAADVASELHRAACEKAGRPDDPDVRIDRIASATETDPLVGKYEVRVFWGPDPVYVELHVHRHTNGTVPVRGDAAKPKQFLVMRTLSYSQLIEAVSPAEAILAAESKLEKTPEEDGWHWDGDDLDVEPEPQPAEEEVTT